MKRIPLEVYEFAGDLRVMAHFILRVEELSRFVPINAIVDTGSPITLIGPLDTKKMRIQEVFYKLRNKFSLVRMETMNMFCSIRFP